MSEEEKKQQEAAADAPEENGSGKAEASAEETTKNKADTASEEKQAEEKDPGKSSEKSADENEKKADAGKSEETEDKDSDAKEDAESGDEKYMRLMADFQNYKRRTEKEKADVYSYANEKIVTDLLKVLDNFERALSQECADEKYAEGMELIFRQMHDVLEKAGLKEIEAVGKEFDPNFHHAVMTDDNEDFESGQVTTVLQKGYTLHDKVIRPAMVRVNN